jgi:tetratricopeptide (TPR) repeat protein
MLKKLLFVILLTGITSLAQADNDLVWKNSYQLEAVKKYAEALSALSVLKANDTDAELLLMRRGWLSYLMAQYNDAIGWYNQALQKNPKSLEARLGLTLPLLAQQRWKEAAQWANKVLEIAPYDYTATLRLILAEEGLRDWSSMKKYSLELAERYPTDATALVYVARSYAWLGDTEDARKVYANVLNRVPGHYEATAYLSKP